MKTTVALIIASTLASSAVLADGFTATSQGGSLIIDGGITGGCTVSSWGGQAVCETGGVSETEIVSRTTRVLEFGEGVFSSRKFAEGSSFSAKESIWTKEGDKTSKSSSNSFAFGQSSGYDIRILGGVEESITDLRTIGSTFLNSSAFVSN